jgi:hypothetical protein
VHQNGLKGGIQMSNMAIILTALLAASEALALIPALKSNSILQVVMNILKGIGAKDPQA